VKIAITSLYLPNGSKIGYVVHAFANALVKRGRADTVFVDALRGIAALPGLFHHLLHNTPLEAPLRKILPELPSLG